MNVTIAHYLSFKDIEKDEDMAILHTCIHVIHASESRAGTHEQISNIMEVDRIHIQMISLDLIHIMCGDVSNIPNAKLTSTTLWMLDTLRILNNYIQCQKGRPKIHYALHCTCINSQGRLLEGTSMSRSHT